MASGLSRTITMFFVYPLTWAVLGTILFTHLIFHAWFEPTVFIQSIAIIIDCFSFALWIMLSITSKNFIAFHHDYLHNKEMRSLRNVLKACPQDFRNPALQCVNIIQKINKEFTDQNYHDELDLFLSNLHKLASNHRNLSMRSQTFGTEQQKEKMVSMLAQQTSSINNTMHTLIAFSGNLTILSANLTQQDVAIKELQFMNQGLQEVIQELDDAQL